MFFYQTCIPALELGRGGLLLRKCILQTDRYKTYYKIGLPYKGISTGERLTGVWIKARRFNFLHELTCVDNVSVKMRKTRDTEKSG